MNKFIFYPSFSCGNSKSWLVKNTKYKNDFPSRFYDDSLKNTNWHHPYTLLSVGHNLTKKELRKDMGCENITVLGDSGGFQIATGALKFKPELTEQIFNWLENNSDIAMNLDIPPVFTYNGKFKECLDISKKNFEYFEKHQTGKTKFLNILQYPNDKDIESWYNEVKHFNFNGWSIGTGTNGTIYQLIFIIKFLQDKQEFSRLSTNYIHFLGLSSIHQFLILNFLQLELNKMYGEKIIISSDSSSSNLSTIFGNYFSHVDWKNLSLKSICFSKKNVELFEKEISLPCSINCPICNSNTFKDLKEWKEYSFMIMTNHNLYITLEINNFLHKILQDDNLIKEFFDNDIFMLLMSIREILQSNNSTLIFDKYKSLYIKLTSKINNSNNQNNIKTNELFDF